MRNFSYNQLPQELFTAEIVNLVSAIHEYKGKQELFIEAKPDILNTMLEVAKIQSTGASNRIEGIFTSDKRLEELVKHKATPKNRNESEISGYREVLATIHESYEYIVPRANTILQLHRNLYSFSPSAIGGVWKNSDNVIAETDINGTRRIRFQPVPAFETAYAMEDLCTAFNDALSTGKYDPLMLIPMFILDFLCIHPFNDGNGRMSRLLTLLLLYRSGYIVGKYMSIEMIIESSKETYYEVLQVSSQNWHDNDNFYAPFVEYYLGTILNAYKEFSSRVTHLQGINKISKSERIKNIFDNTLGKISKKEIELLCPDISKSMIELTLGELVKSSYIEKVGVGRATAYVKKQN